MRPGRAVYSGAINREDMGYVDVVALTESTDGQLTNYGLLHVPTGKYLRVKNHRGGASYSVGDVPTLRTKAVLAYWRNRMKQPEEWRFVKFRIVPEDEYES